MPENPLLREERSLIRRPASHATVRGVVLFPGPYTVGMSSLAVHSLYTLLNTGQIACERAFVETPRKSVFSLETDTLLRDFDFVAITSSYEIDWLGLPRALQVSGIQPRRTERSRRPLVLMGGPAVTAAPLPLSELYDAALIGELEPVLAQFREALLASDPAACLEQLAAVPGFYVPELHSRPAPGALQRRCALDLDAFEAVSAILTPHTEFANRFLVEMGRGCGRACAFCLARRAYHPLRWRSLPHLLASVRRGLYHTTDLGLIAAAVSDYPDLDGLCHELARLSLDLRVSTSSVRLESASPPFLRLLARGGQQTVTYAPEAATERLRRAIGKPVTDDEIFAAIERALAAGLTRLRLYFMVGLPGETDDDREAIVTMARELSGRFRQAHFRLNVGAFSPRPHTPFECQPMAHPRSVQSWITALSHSLRPVKRVEVSAGSARESALQCLLSRADERVLEALCALPDEGLGTALRGLRAVAGRELELLGPRGATDPQPWKVVDFSCADTAIST
ncbi:MAG: radical SAM protein [Armatimonadetes bacterium]|nr:radical SAM protein [Armatimonadota bacterium]